MVTVGFGHSDVKPDNDARHKRGDHCDAEVGKETYWLKRSYYSNCVLGLHVHTFRYSFYDGVNRNVQCN